MTIVPANARAIAIRASVGPPMSSGGPSNAGATGIRHMSSHGMTDSHCHISA